MDYQISFAVCYCFLLTVLFSIPNFQTENTDFITNCPKNVFFKKKALSVCPLEVTAKVLTEDLPDVSSDVLALYFEKEGVEMQNVTRNEEEQFAIITFKTPRGIYTNITQLCCVCACVCV